MLPTVQAGRRIKIDVRDFPGGTAVKNPPANAGGHAFAP